MSITHAELGVDEDLGRRILVRARIIAPCLDSFDAESEEGKNAIAILKGVIAELPAPGESRMRSMSRNGTSVSFAQIASAFEGDPTVSLRSLCASATRAGLPQGSFPKPHSVVERYWPEGTYS
jgi:hypothetical protein